MIRLKVSRTAGVVGAVVAVAGLARTAEAQSLFLRPAPVVASEPGRGTQDPNRVIVNEQLKTTSMIYIDPPKAKTYQIHDLVTIVIDENTSQASNQLLDTQKDYNLSGQLTQFPSLKYLLDGQLETGDRNPVANVGTSNTDKFKGQGKYSRTDTFVAKVTAQVIDVKPNGMLVLEARKTIKTNKEEQVLVLSGTCRREDVTNLNTVLSSQLAELTLISQNEGHVKDASDKGWISRVLSTIFDF